MSLIGIDFGTSNCRAAHFGVKGAPEIIRDAAYPESTALLPSLVTFHEDGGVSVGWEARKKRILFPLSTISSVKRKLFKTDAPSAIETGFFKLPEGKLGAPDKITALLFKEIKRQAEISLKSDGVEAVLSVPYCSGPEVRHTLENVARSAGLTPLALIQDTAAAALACSFLEKKNGITAIFSMGAGFFEFSIFDLRDKSIELLASGGEMTGGLDMDKRIAQHLFSELEQVSEHAVKHDPFLVQKVLEESEKAKGALSHRGSYDFQVEDAACHIHFSRALSRFELAQWVHEVIDRTAGICEQVLKAAGLKQQDIANVVLAGGAVRMPLVQETAEKILRKKSSAETNPDLMVVFGASVYAEILGEKISGWTVKI